MTEPSGLPNASAMKPKRSSVLNVRMQAALRERIENEALAQDMTASALVRRVLAQRYEPQR